MLKRMLMAIAVLAAWDAHGLPGELPPGRAGGIGSGGGVNSREVNRLDTHVTGQAGARVNRLDTHVTGQAGASSWGGSSWHTQVFGQGDSHVGRLGMGLLAQTGAEGLLTPGVPDGARSQGAQQSQGTSTHRINCVDTQVARQRDSHVSRLGLGLVAQIAQVGVEGLLAPGVPDGAGSKSAQSDQGSSTQADSARVRADAVEHHAGVLEAEALAWLHAELAKPAERASSNGPTSGSGARAGTSVPGPIDGETADARDSLRFEIRGPNVDRRLAVPECPVGFSFSHSGDLSGRVLLRATCPTRAWTTHLPVEVLLYRQVLAAKSSLKRGTVLADADLEYVEVEVSKRARHYLVDMTQVVGQALKRSVRPRTVITAGMLLAPKAVERGDAVTIVAAGAAVEVRVPGVAITGGSIGKQVTVRNVSSNQIVRGWVRAPGLVFVPL